MQLVVGRELAEQDRHRLGVVPQVLLDRGHPWRHAAFFLPPEPAAGPGGARRLLGRTSTTGCRRVSRRSASEGEHGHGAYAKCEKNRCLPMCMCVVDVSVDSALSLDFGLCALSSVDCAECACELRLRCGDRGTYLLYRVPAPAPAPAPVPATGAGAGTAEPVSGRVCPVLCVVM